MSTPPPGEPQWWVTSSPPPPPPPPPGPPPPPPPGPQLPVRQAAPGRSRRSWLSVFGASLIVVGLVASIGVALLGRRLASIAAEDLVRLPPACSVVVEVAEPGTYNLYIERRTTLSAERQVCAGPTTVDLPTVPRPPSVSVRGVDERPVTPAAGEGYDVKAPSGARFVGQVFSTVVIDGRGPVTISTGAAGDQPAYVAIGLADNSPAEVRDALRRWSLAPAAVAVAGLVMFGFGRRRRRRPSNESPRSAEWMPPRGPMQSYAPPPVN